MASALGACRVDLAPAPPQSCSERKWSQEPQAKGGQLGPRFGWLPGEATCERTEGGKAFHGRGWRLCIQEAEMQPPRV